MAFKRKAKSTTKKRTTRRKASVSAPKKRRTTRKAPAAKHTRRKSSHRLGGSGGKTDIKSLLMNVAIGVAGAAAVSFALGHIPKKADGTSMIPENIAPFAPIAIGAALAVILGKKHKMAVSAGTGAMIGGALNLLKVHVPQLGLAGEEQLKLTPEQVRGALLGYGETDGDETYLGENISLLGTNIQLADDVSGEYDGDIYEGEYEGDASYESMMNPS